MKLITPLFLCLSLSFAADSFTLHLKKNGKQETQTAHLILQEKGVMMETTDNDYSMFFDRAKKNLTIMDHKEKSWFQLDKPTIQKIHQQIIDSKKMMIQQMKAMPAQQQAMMKEILESKFGPMDEESFKSEPNVVSLDSTDKKGLNGPCQWYGSKKGTDLQSSFCLEKVSTSHWQSMIDFGSFLDELNKVPQITDASPFSLPPSNFLDQGLPVIYNSFREGKLSETTTVTKKETIKDKDFSIPKGYKERKLPF